MALLVWNALKIVMTAQTIMDLWFVCRVQIPQRVIGTTRPQRIAHVRLVILRLAISKATAVMRLVCLVTKKAVCHAYLSQDVN